MRRLSTKMTCCSTRSTVVAPAPPRPATGSRSIPPASAAISFGMVAEKNRVCRFAGIVRDDAADRDEEAEVEHLVGLVEHQHLDLVEPDGAVAEVVDQAAGGGDEHVDAAGDRADLARASARRRTPAPTRDAGVAAIGAEALGDLAGQFAGRGEHQRAAGAGAGRRLPAPRRCRIGRAKAAVLPVPVWAMPCTSRPASADGMAWVWIGVGACSPRSRAP